LTIEVIWDLVARDKSFCQQRRNDGERGSRSGNMAKKEWKLDSIIHFFKYYITKNNTNLLLFLLAFESVCVYAHGFYSNCF
jgi:hypothetical protein